MLTLPFPCVQRPNDVGVFKFADRFHAVELLAEERGMDMTAVGLEALDALWDEVKAQQASEE